MAPHVGQDRRILLVTYNDETLFNTGIRSPLDRGILARALANIDAMGAKAIGIDIVFDAPRPDDELLTDRLRALRTPTWLACAEHSDRTSDVSGTVGSVRVTLDGRRRIKKKTKTQTHHT